MPAAEKKTEPEIFCNSPELNGNAILEFLAGLSPEPASRSVVVNGTGMTASEFSASVRVLLSEGKVVRVGEKRGTKYHLPSDLRQDAPPVASSRPLTEEQFNEIWKDACNRMSKMGVSYVKIADFTRAVTGHNSASAAFVSGNLSTDKIERIFLMGENWVASSTGALQ